MHNPFTQRRSASQRQNGYAEPNTPPRPPRLIRAKGAATNPPQIPRRASAQGDVVERGGANWVEVAVLAMSFITIFRSLVGRHSRVGAIITQYSDYKYVQSKKS